MWSIAPSSRHIETWVSRFKAVIMITGMCRVRSSAFSFCNVAMPSKPGIKTSSKMRSGCSLSAMSRACRPSAASRSLYGSPSSASRSKLAVVVVVVHDQDFWLVHVSASRRSSWSRKVRSRLASSRTCVGLVMYSQQPAARARSSSPFMA